MTDVAPSPRHTNRLAAESSPYLLQHAHNPVDWYPWGAEAFDAARKQNKPIFLSVGYSTCYWCHVMERQSFENEAVAAEMNQRFINIKVDREERPDVDQLYMTAVQVLTRHGGWPMSVFLTPDLRPFYGGTYFPPTDAQGRPGFISILLGIEDAWKNRRADVEKTADQLVNILGQYARPAGGRAPSTIDDAFVDDLIRRSVSDYDPKHGGFGGAPKFPRETLLELLLVYLQQSPAAGQPQSLKTQISKMIFHTLEALADGGIRDQLGGGFHRYSTDAVWLVPHFEIMLYDNAMLGWCYAEAFSQTNNTRYAEVARGVFDFVLREMTAPAGGFYTAIDAEVDGQEGLNYLWTAGEIESILGRDDARLFNTVYGVDRGPNFADPHHGAGVPDKCILFLPVALEQVASTLKMDCAALEARLMPLRQKLYQSRMTRKQPILDTKVITSWNALMIRALAHGGSVLKDARYTAAAEKAADFLLNSHGTSGGGLFRASRDGRAKYEGFLDDYSFLVQSLLALYETTGQKRWKDRADTLADVMLQKFGDAQDGGFYFTEEGAADLIIRQKSATDSPLPSGNAVAAMALLQLGKYGAARDTLAAFSQQVESQGEAMSSMVQAALSYLRAAGKFSAAADFPGEADTRPLSPSRLAQDVVTPRIEWKSPVELMLHLRISPGYHIYANDIAADLSLVATRVSVAEDGVASIDYPAGDTLQMPTGEKLFVYSGDAAIRVRFSNAFSSGSTVTLTVVYQACDESACLPPVTRQIQSHAP